jgi:hypothetical protein
MEEVRLNTIKICLFCYNTPVFESKICWESEKCMVKKFVYRNCSRINQTYAQFFPCVNNPGYER